MSHSPNKRSLAQRLVDYLKAHGGWVHGGTLERKAQEAGYKASNGSRRLRVLEEASRGVETTPEHLRAKEILNGARIVAEYQQNQVGYRYVPVGQEAVSKADRPKYRYEQVQKPDGTWVAREIVI